MIFRTREHARRKPLHSPLMVALGLCLLGAHGVSAHAANLMDIYQASLQYNTELQAARHDLQVAQANVPLARSAWRPQLSLDAESGITYRETDAADEDFGESLLSLSATQALYNRANSTRVEQAEIALAEAQARYSLAQQQLILRTSYAYFDVLRAEADIEFSNSEIEATRQQREQAQRRFDVGLVPVVDVRSAEAQYDLALARQTLAADRRSAAGEALAVLSGIRPDEVLADIDPSLPMTPPEPSDSAAWVQFAQDQNLELLATLHRVEQTSLQIDIERSARLPTLDLVGSASHLNTESSERVESSSAQVALQLQWPLYNGGRISALTAQAKATADAVQDRWLGLELATTEQTRRTYRSVLSAITRSEALEQALDSTQASAEATKAGFGAGTRTSVEVLEALRDVYEARSAFVNARYDYLVNSLQLEADAGRLDEGDVQTLNTLLNPTP